MTGTLEECLESASQLWRMNRVPEAIAAYERVLSRWPDLANSWYNLGLLQRQAGRLQAALSSYRRALTLGISAPEEVHLNCGVIHADLGQDEAAEREVRIALKLNPAYVPALLNLANLCENLGRRDEACDLYGRVLALEPKRYEALARLANAQPACVSRASVDREDVGRAANAAERDHSSMLASLRRAIADPAASAAEKASLGFALGRLLDDRRDYDAAFAAYRQANLDSRTSAGPGFRGYDRPAHEAFVEQLLYAFPRRSPESRVVADQTRHTHPTPIFICGMFRSGSTLAERLLSAHPAVRAGGELGLIPGLVAGPLRPFPASMASVSADVLSRMASGYVEELGRRCPGAIYGTDKRPDNFLYLGLIKKLFPAAKIVHTTREPLDNCLSIYFLHLDHSVSYALDLRDIGHCYRQYRRVMDHWRALYGEDILDFHYDALVHDPEPAAKRLFGFLGLDWQDRYLELPARGAVRTASVWQVREPVYQRSSGRARHYQVWLRDLERELQEELCNPR
ncbi:MAG: tetratricopeptide repeat-containing sulfotransferase family protein [Steroidobacteraceae bacterium]